jgi:hypothetical protein
LARCVEVGVPHEVGVPAQPCLPRLSSAGKPWGI